MVCNSIIVFSIPMYIYIYYGILTVRLAVGRMYLVGTRHLTARIGRFGRKERQRKRSANGVYTVHFKGKLYVL